MNNQDKLSQLIISLGEYALKELLDGFEKGIDLSHPIESTDEIYDESTLIGDLFRRMCEIPNHCQRINNIVSEINKEQKDYSGNKNTLLAAGLWRHDIKGFHSWLNMIIRGLNAKHSDLEQSIKSALHIMIRYREFYKGAAYLASNGDERFLSRTLPVKYAEELFFSLGHIKDTTPNFKNTPQFFDTASFVALQQIIKNTPSNVKGEFYFKSRGCFYEYGVQDEGLGLLDQNGDPFNDSNIHKIFEGYSSSENKNKGLGLQVVKALVELRGGFVEVLTKTKGNDPLHYSIHPNRMPSIVNDYLIGDLSKLEHYTKFCIWIPRGCFD